MFSKLPLSFSFQLGLEFLDVLAEHTTTVFGFLFHLFFYLSKFLLVFTLLLLFNLNQFLVELLLHLLSLGLKSAIDFSSELLKL
jgi:hypothetical protein